jgi:NAD(P)-dependent dehydrogenase (short-subunit alcohol dehydrogenase family)
MTQLAGKSVLVTGGSRGIGAAISRAVGAAGAQVLVHCARNRAAAEPTSRSPARWTGCGARPQGWRAASTSW